MPAWCHRRLLQRLLAALLVAAFLPLATLAHACQTVRHLTAAQLLPAAAVHAVTGTARHADSVDAPAAHQPVDVLAHPGPCHLLMTAALLGQIHRLELAVSDTHWQRGQRCAFLSCRWPPPEHRPRHG